MSEMSRHLILSPLSRQSECKFKMPFEIHLFLLHPVNLFLGTNDRVEVSSTDGWNFPALLFLSSPSDRNVEFHDIAIIERVKETSRGSKVLLDFIEWKLLKLRDKGRFVDSSSSMNGIRPIREEFLFQIIIE